MPAYGKTHVLLLNREEEQRKKHNLLVFRSTTLFDLLLQEANHTAQKTREGKVER